MTSRVLLAVGARTVALSLLLLSLASCVRVKSFSALNPPIQLAAPSGIQLLHAGASGEPVVACTVLEVQGLLEEVRGDTIRISSVQPGRPIRFAPACPALEEVIVVASNHADLTAPGLRREANPTALEKTFVRLLKLYGVALVAFLVLTAFGSAY